MTKRAIISVVMGVALVGATALTADVPAAVATSPRPAVPATQSFTGAGTGLYDPTVSGEQTFRGAYTSTGQLGNGKFVMTVSSDSSARFTRSDGVVLVAGADTRTTTVGCGPLDASSVCVRVALDGGDDVLVALVYVKARKAPPAPFPGMLSADFTLSGSLSLAHRVGYAMVGSNGAVYGFGGLDRLGDAPTTDATDLERTSSGSGYWIVDAVGHVYAYGDAPYLGNAPTGALAPGERVTSMTATPTAHGYWLFTSRGRVFTFGDARFFGDLRSIALNGGIVGSVATPTGAGYYMVGSDGGVFAFGDARFRGSMGGTHLNQPVVGLVPTAANTGYWLVAADGGVFSFNAPFLGSMGGLKLNRPVVTMVRYGSGYLMVADDGGLFVFSTLPYFGSLGGTTLSAPIVGGTAAS